MSTTTLPTLPSGYRPLDFELPRFAEQDRINAAAARWAAEDWTPGRFAPEVARLIRQTAAGQLAAYPQYDGAFDRAGWTLVRFTEHVVGKGGCRFAEGDYAIADLTPEVMPFASVGAPTVTAYSVRGAVHCSVFRGSFEVVR